MAQPGPSAYPQLSPLHEPVAGERDCHLRLERSGAECPEHSLNFCQPRSRVATNAMRACPYSVSIPDEKGLNIAFLNVAAATR
jgi:hypothetical protein